MNESISLSKALKKFQVRVDEASPSTKVVEHSLFDEPVSEHDKMVTISGVKVQLPENQMNRLFALVSGKTAEDEEGREKLGMIEEEKRGIKENIREEVEESEKIERNKRKCNEEE